MKGLPEKGQVYKHRSARGQWEVVSCGPVRIRLKSNLLLPSMTIPTDGFMKAGWERIR